MVIALFRKYLSPINFIKKNSKLGILIYNISRWIKGFSFKIKYSSETKMEIFDKDLHIHWQFHPIRLPLYSEGLRKRSEIISNSYGLELINFGENDTIIDCGANSGDFFLYFYLNNIDVKYFGLEPSTFDFFNLTKNLSNFEFSKFQKLISNAALGDFIGKTPFSLDVEGANSSILEIPNPKGLEYVDCITLDHYVSQNNINQIKLLKLEAEGAEPEVLLGSEKSISFIEYVTVDCGPERGLLQESTEPFVDDFLVRNNFKKIFSSHSGYRILYKNNMFNLLN
jgi:FkbM family methyltransferase